MSTLHKDHRDSLQWINEFARILSSAHKTPYMRADVQSLIEPAFPDRQATTEEVWHWFRKT